MLWVLRPGVPSLPGSLSAPLTVEAIEGVILWLLWLVVGLFALALLFKAPRSGPRRAVVKPPPQRLRTERPLRSFRQGRQPLPSLVVVSPQSASHAPEHDHTAVAEQRPVQPAALTSDLPVRPSVSVLGTLAIAGTKRSRRGLRAAALELIAYLVLNPRPVQRDELLEAFWPGVDPRRSRPRLHQAVRDARRLLGNAIASERDRYWLDRKEVDVDLDELELLLTEAKTAERDCAQQLLEQALALFAGEPLAGSDYAWAEGELRRLRATYVELLIRVGRNRLDAGQANGALEVAEQGLLIDALNEALWRLALEAEAALGLREAVTKRYEQLRALLDERLGLEPTQETRILHRHLLAQR